MARRHRTMLILALTVYAAAPFMAGGCGKGSVAGQHPIIGRWKPTDADVDRAVALVVERELAQRRELERVGGDEGAKLLAREMRRAWQLAALGAELSALTPEQVAEVVRSRFGREGFDFHPDGRVSSLAGQGGGRWSMQGDDVTIRLTEGLAGGLLWVELLGRRDDMGRLKLLTMTAELSGGVRQTRDLTNPQECDLPTLLERGGG